jgi:hypothetical protein
MSVTMKQLSAHARMAKERHILARAPIFSSRQALAGALFCPYGPYQRTSIALQDAAMQRITCREQTNAYCTYGKCVACRTFAKQPLLRYSPTNLQLRPLAASASATAQLGRVTLLFCRGKQVLVEVLLLTVKEPSLISVRLRTFSTFRDCPEQGLVRLWDL